MLFFQIFYLIYYNVRYNELFTLYLFAIMNVMKDRMIILMPKLEKLLINLGENMRLARLRRRLTVDQVCERADIGRTTLWQIEKGMPNVAIGAYVQVLFVLGLEKDLLDLASDDELGRRLQDAQIEIKRRGPKKR